MHFDCTGITEVAINRIFAIYGELRTTLPQWFMKETFEVSWLNASRHARLSELDRNALYAACSFTKDHHHIILSHPSNAAFVGSWDEDMG